jgi:ferredoxin
MPRGRSRLRAAARWAVRLLLLAAAVAFALGGPLPVWLARLFPSTSALAALAGGLAARRWHLGLLWAMPPLALAALAFWRGRVFCKWICPAGTLYSLPARLSLKKRVLKPRLGGYLFWAILAASLFGAPVLLFLDPLSTFNRLTVPLRAGFSAAWLVLGLLLPAMLVLGAVQPMVWCSHLCPLGYWFELCRRARGWLSRRRSPAPGATAGHDRTRREIVVGLALGLPLGALARFLALTKSSPARAPVLPPGASDPASFAAACSRCYACLNACPRGVIRVSSPVDRAPGQFFQPELDPAHGFCDEFCNRCSQVCASGALAPLSVDEKRARQIGVARVVREACLAWADGEYCMVCEEYCPYHAISPSEDQKGVPRPVVDEKLCRGCGLCQHECPATRAGKAIIVHGVERQRQLDVELWHFEKPAESGRSPDPAPRT